MRKVIERSIGGTDDKLPVAVALLDGDAAGSRAFTEIEQSGLLHKDYLVLIDQLGLTNPAVEQVRVLEDLVPVRILALACTRQLASREASELTEDGILKMLSDRESGPTSADRLKLLHKSERLLEKLGIEQDEFRSAVIEELCEWLTGDMSPVSPDDAKTLEMNLRAVCKALSKALDLANLDSAQKTIKKRVVYHVKEFRKSHQRVATAADVQRYLGFLLRECRGAEPELVKARTKIEAMITELSRQADGADVPVDRNQWVKRLENFASTPWN